ncbi:suppressor of glycerol defect, partial [Nowakowskiella sp. JEL0078]
MRKKADAVLFSGKAVLPKELLFGENGPNLNSTANFYNKSRFNKKKMLGNYLDRKEKRKQSKKLVKNKTNPSSHSTTQKYGSEMFIQKKDTIISKKKISPTTSKTHKDPSNSKQLKKLSQSNPAFVKLLQSDNLISIEHNLGATMFEEDDKEIARYAKLLGIKSKSGAGKIMRETGFDEFDDLLKFSILDNEYNDIPTSLDNDVNFGNVMYLPKIKLNEKDDEENESEEPDDDIEMDIDTDDLDFIDDERGNEDIVDEGVSEDKIFSDHFDMSKVSDELEDSQSSEAVSEVDNEDYSQQKISKETKIIESTTAGKYIPPHLRKQLESESPKSETYMRLKRQLQGLLNRLSDANMESIVNSVDELFRKNSRHDMMEIITDTIVTVVADHSNLLDSFVLTYAGFIAVVFNLIGTDVGATFIQFIVELWDKSRLESIKLLRNTSISSRAVAVLDQASSKRSTNLCSLIACLYNLEVMSSVLIYDIVRESISSLTELDVEILLKLLKISGHQMRSDDPTALKEIVALLQIETSKLDRSKLNLRFKFMLETITELKNNRHRKSIMSNQSDANSLQLGKMKKFCAMMIKKRQISGSESLRMSLSDIRNIKTRGKWWLVGSAWTPQNENIAEQMKETSKIKEELPENVNLMDKLMILARKQKMNTDVRRSVFVVLMSSEDYLDAFERLEKIGLKDKQEREIMRVIIHCCSQ